MPVAFWLSFAALTSRAGGVPFLFGRMTCVACVILPGLLPWPYVPPIRTILKIIDTLFREDSLME